jgi:hypothetical protein
VRVDFHWLLRNRVKVNSLSTASLQAISDRLVDLLPIVGGAVYFPEFRFSDSIKSVAPALCPGFVYHDLDGVADDGAASAAFLQLASGYLTVQERGIRAKISLNPRSHLQHIQRPTPSHLSKNAPSLQGVGRADVA